MGSKQSTASSPSRAVVQTDDNSSTITSSTYSNQYRNTRPLDGDQIVTNSRDWRQRARSLTAVLTGDPTAATRPSHSSAIDFSSTSSQDILNEDNEFSSLNFTPHSLPIRFLQYNFNHFKCLFCSKIVLQDDIECHLLMCITKPILIYNEDVLTEDKGECVICLEEMLKGNTIARLPCLCIYHKKCIDAWFQVNRSCPEHPVD